MKQTQKSKIPRGGSRAGKRLDKKRDRSVRVCRYGTAKMTGWFSPDGDDDEDAVKSASGSRACGILSRQEWTAEDQKERTQDEAGPVPQEL